MCAGFHRPRPAQRMLTQTERSTDWRPPAGTSTYGLATRPRASAKLPSTKERLVGGRGEFGAVWRKSARWSTRAVCPVSSAILVMVGYFHRAELILREAMARRYQVCARGDLQSRVLYSACRWSRQAPVGVFQNLMQRSAVPPPEASRFDWKEAPRERLDGGAVGGEAVHRVGGGRRCGAGRARHGGVPDVTHVVVAPGRQFCPRATT